MLPLRSPSRLLGVALLICAAMMPLACDARIHRLTIDKDERATFSIETFGFRQGGQVKLEVKNFDITSKQDKESAETFKVGFIFQRIDSETAAEADLEEREQEGCLFDDGTPGFTFPLNNVENWKSFEFTPHVISKEEAGLYHFIFTRCTPATGHVSFELEATLMNPGPDYLSSTETPLPSMYAIVTVCYFIALIAWVAAVRGNLSKVHRVHVMMTVLLVFKLLSLLFESIWYHYIKTRGFAVGWNVVFYIFTAVKGIMLFIVILLIGTGYSLMKNFLNDREKRVIGIVLILQVINNIAFVVLEETAPGSQAYSHWRDILHIVDILCCTAILVPIVWSIRHLREASQTDGKASASLQRLKQFRSFYLWVVAYIYFTRIVVYLVGAMLPFHYIWLRLFFTEAATLLFFTRTGYSFRPGGDNPYLPVKGEDDENLDEFGLDVDDDLELTAP